MTATFTRRYDARTWRTLADDELRRWLQLYRVHLALVDEECEPEEREPTRRYLAALVTDGQAEQSRRLRATTLGAPAEADRFPAAWLADLKRRVKLDELLIYEAGARLGAERHGKRRGPCPFCKASEHSDCFIVHTADADDQWYYCHRCGAAGDAVSAIMQAYGDPFPLAVERLARHGNIPLPGAPPPPFDPGRYLDLARGGATHA